MKTPIHITTTHRSERLTFDDESLDAEITHAANAFIECIEDNDSLNSKLIEIMSYCDSIQKALTGLISDDEVKADAFQSTVWSAIMQRISDDR